MKESPRMIVVLTVIAMLSGLVLAFTFNMTNDKILHNAELKKQRAIKEVLPGLETYEMKQKGELEYYQGYNAQGNPVGIAVEAVGGGFSGDINLMIGIIPSEERITGIKVLKHLETPGLGARITENDFKSNFEDKEFGDYEVVKHPVRDEMQVQAITGATISSNAVTEIVQKTVDKVADAYGGDQS